MPIERHLSRQTAPTSYSCPGCGRMMRVALVEPGGPDCEKRQFDCSDCKESTTVVVEYY